MAEDSHRAPRVGLQPSSAAYATEPTPKSRCTLKRQDLQDSLHKNGAAAARRKRGLTTRPPGDPPGAPTSPNFQGWPSEWPKSLRPGWHTHTTQFSKCTTPLFQGWSLRSHQESHRAKWRTRCEEMEGKRNTTTNQHRGYTLPKRSGARGPVETFLYIF